MSVQQYLPVGSVTRRSDARSLVEADLVSLTESIRTLGLMNPISCRAIGDTWEVIAGSNRLEAMIRLGETEILATILDLDDRHAELAMIDENLMRTELSASDRARQTARRKAIYEELCPETKHGGDRKSDQVANLARPRACSTPRRLRPRAATRTRRQRCWTSPGASWRRACPTTPRDPYYKDFNEVQGVLKAADVKAGQQITESQRQLQVLKDQVRYLIDLNDTTKTVAQAIADLKTAVLASNNASGYQTAWKGGKVTKADPIYGWNIPKNQGIAAALKERGLNFQGTYGTGQLENWQAGLSDPLKKHVQEIIDYYTALFPKAPGYAGGGLIRGYAAGGMVGNGTWGRDSVLARYAGGGHIGLAGGEMVVTARHVTPQTWPVLDQINRTGRVPGNDNAALITELRELRRESRENAKAMMQMHQTLSAQEQKVQRETSAEAQRRSAQGNRIAERRAALTA